MSGDKMSGKLEMWQVKYRQNLPLHIKIKMSIARIQAWYEYWDGKIFVSFSGGKDSTVLLHLVRSIYPETTGVFFDTGLEYPEIREYVKKYKNIVWMKPRKTFMEVIEEYGYPVLSKELSHIINRVQANSNHIDILKKIPKRWLYVADAPFKISDRCCYWLRKEVSKRYSEQSGQKPLLGTRVCESRLRLKAYINTGCNSYSGKIHSTPLAFWMDNDVAEYIKQNKIKLAKIYDMGYNRTGCMFCMFGVQHDGEPNRFQKMKKTHPRHYNLCIKKMKIGQVLDYIGIHYE